MKKDDGNTFQTGPDIVIPISYQSGFFASVSVTGASRQEVWGNLLDVFTAACESKQNNDGIWPISVSTNRGKIEINDNICNCGTHNQIRTLLEADVEDDLLQHVKDLITDRDNAVAKTKAVKSAVVATVGGLVEGRATHSGNYLQRIRQLMEAETQIASIKADTLKKVAGLIHDMSRGTKSEDRCIAIDEAIQLISDEIRILSPIET